MEEKTIEINPEQMRAYIVDKFKAEGDFDFLKEGELEQMAARMQALDQQYTESVGDGIYDDDDAYDALFAAMQQDYPQYKMYCMRLCEDYLDFAEEYLVSIDAIEWE